MAGRRRIIWADTAKAEFNSTCSYWNKRNLSFTYSKKLRKLVREALKRIGDFPLSGIPSEFEKIQFVVIEDYCLFYYESENNIIVTSFWDARQYPEKLKTRLE